MRNAIRTTDALGRALDLRLPVMQSDFPLLVPWPYVDRMQPGRLDDPLLRQVLPQREEQDEQEGFSADPLRETQFTGPSKGVIQKYAGRALIISTGACAVNCRYCFRRHFPYQQHQAGKSGWQSIVSHVAADSGITEVILSGGDPLVLSDDQLARLTSALDRIPHVQTIRLHTRVPVVIPQRLCDSLLDWVGSLRARVVFVLHINHPNEIDELLIRAVDRLQHAGVTLLNQSVLLAGVNDDASTLTSLSTQLFKAGILPYYLHLLDPVAGASHFDVSEERGRELAREASESLPGYLVPRLVREVPGEKSKQAIAIF